jgi:hypothetical protein
VPVLRGFSIVYTRFWALPEGATPKEAAAHRAQVEKACLAHLNVLINHFGRASITRPRGDGEEGERVEPLIDGSRLRAQLPYFVDAICAWADGPKEVVEEAAAPSEDEEVVVVESDDDSGGEWELMVEEGEAAPKRKPWWQAGPSDSQRFWCATAHSPKGAHMSEWLLLAKLAFTLVPGSVEEERMFSAMKFLKNAQRNRLLAEYLTAAARLFKDSAYTVDNFDFPRALKFWHDKKPRRTGAAKKRKIALKKK